MSGTYPPAISAQPADSVARPATIAVDSVPQVPIVSAATISQLKPPAASLAIAPVEVPDTVSASKSTESFSEEDADALVRNLGEVVVEADRRMVIKDGVLYRPTTREKRASQTATDLIALMGVPELRATIGSLGVSTVTSEPVSIFIDYLPADESDLKGMRMIDVKEVQYLQSPEDPRFMGARNVLNYIMKKYEYGGYTKLYAQENPFWGFYNDATVTSKFTYKSMVYDVFAESKNFNLKHEGTESDQYMTLSDPAAGSVDLHRYYRTLDSRFTRGTYPLTFRATYATDKVTFRNTLGYTHEGLPKNMKQGLLGLEGGDQLGIASGEYTFIDHHPQKANNLNYESDLFVILPKGWSLSVRGTLGYSHRNQYYLYSTDLPTELRQDTKENAWNWELMTFVQKNFTHGHSAFAIVSGSESINKLHYTGDTNNSTVSKVPKVSPSVGYTYSVPKVRISAGGGTQWVWNNIGNARYLEFVPSVNGNARFNFNTHNSLYCYFGYFLNTPGLSQKNPETLQQNEFIYTRGVPDMKGQQYFTSLLSYHWLPSKAFSLNGSVSERHIDNAYTVEYQPYLDGRALLKTYSTGNKFNDLKLSLSCNWKAIQGILNLTGGVSQIFDRLSGREHLSCNYASYYINAYGFIGNVTWSASYSSPGRTLSMNSARITKTVPNYNIYIGWNIKDVNLSVSASNFFNKGWKTGTYVYASPLYHDTGTSYGMSGHAQVYITATWSVGYGKTIQRGDEAEAIKATESAISM